MKKLSLILMILTLLTGFYFQSSANNSDEVEILSKIVEIEKIQEIITSEAPVIVTNGLISDNIQVYIDDQPILLQNTDASNTPNKITVEKFNQNANSAQILMVSQGIKIKVKLIKADETWQVKSCYVKNGNSFYATVSL